MKRKLGIFALLLAALLVAAVPAAANSALMYWDGAGREGAMPLQEDCPLTVEKEELTFRLGDFPSIDKDNSAYHGTVTAAYTFRNPSAEDVTATLAFPYGSRPLYLAPEGEEAHSILVDGAPAEVKLRCTYYLGAFDIAAELPKLREDGPQDAFFRPDLPVTRYVFETTAMPKEGEAPSGALTFGQNEAYRVLAPEWNGFRSDKETVVISRFLQEGERFTLLILGEPPETLPEWAFYTDMGLEKEAEGGEIRLASQETLTFGEMAMLHYDPASGYPEADWYDAYTDMLAFYALTGDGEAEEVGMMLGGPFDEKDFPVLPAEQLMRWYEYEIKVPAGGSILNEVTAPIYPAIDLTSDPAAYDYTYLLSPASTWAEFGTLDIRIETGAYLLESSEAFEMTGTEDQRVYEAHLGSLPEEELTFRLCESADPAKKRNAYSVLPVILLGVVILLGGAVLAIVAALIHRWLKRRK